MLSQTNSALNRLNIIEIWNETTMRILPEKSGYTSFAMVTIFVVVLFVGEGSVTMTPVWHPGGTRFHRVGTCTLLCSSVVPSKFNTRKERVISRSCWITASEWSAKYQREANVSMVFRTKTVNFSSRQSIKPTYTQRNIKENCNTKSILARKLKTYGV